MKAIAILLLTAILSAGVISTKEMQANSAQASAERVELESKRAVISKAASVKRVAAIATPLPTPVATPVAKPTTAIPLAAPAAAPGSDVSCRQAIADTWPQSLQAGAITVLVNENHSERADAIGKPNADLWKSQDYGCFQINNHWHATFFATNNWRDPVANARYAYQHIYLGRQNYSAWYAVKGILW